MWKTNTDMDSVYKKILNPFTFKDKNFKVWCYFSGPADHRTLWHSHTKTANINCVIYLQTIQDYGIEFELYQQAQQRHQKESCAPRMSRN